MNQKDRLQRETNEINAQRVLARLNGKEYLIGKLGDIFTEPSPSDPLQNLKNFRSVSDFISETKYHPRTRMHHLSMLHMAWILKRNPEVFGSTLRSTLYTLAHQIFGRLWDVLADNPSVFVVEGSGHNFKVKLVCGPDVLDDFNGGEVITSTEFYNPNVFALSDQYLSLKIGQRDGILPIFGSTALLKVRKNSEQFEGPTPQETIAMLGGVVRVR